MLIDFVLTVSGVSNADAAVFIKATSGDPANVAVCIAKLGGSAAFIGKRCFLRHGMHWPSDANMDVHRINQPRKAWDSLAMPEGPMTRGRIKQFKKTLNDIMVKHQEEATNMMSKLEEVGWHQGSPCNILQVEIEGRNEEIGFSSSRIYATHLA